MKRINQCKIMLAVGMISSSVVAEASKPNFLLINVDDLGWSDLSFQGSTYYQTPNIDKLASEGVVFSNAYAAAANCAPSRACMISGQYGPRHGVYTVLGSERGKSEDRKLIPTKNTLHLKEDNITFGGALKLGGYRTATIGKWHVSDDPLKYGFDINIAGNHRGGPYTGGYHSPYKFPNCVDNKKGVYLTDRLTNEAIKFMKESKDKPFFLYLPYYTVHTPLQAKKEKVDKYKKIKGSKAHNSPVYAAMIESLDENIGRLTQFLEKSGLAENTMVIFTSDNGGVWSTSKQWPLRAGKGAYYEGGIREPLIIRWPGKIKAGSKSDVPVCQIDFYPTMLEASNTQKPKGKLLDGVSLMPLFESKELADRALYWHFPIYLQKSGKSDETRDPIFRTRPGSAIRYGKWKLHQYFEDGGLELYNLENDMGEKINLAKKNPEVTKELFKKLENWRTLTNAPVPTKLNPGYKKNK